MSGCARRDHSMPGTAWPPYATKPNTEAWRGRVSPAPEYPKIVEALRVSITSGELPKGSQMPSESTLAARFGVARNTIRRALAELQREGLIVTVPGKGWIVRDPAALALQPDETPLAYLRIANELRRNIERGAYAADGRLPSEAALARQYGVSRETARRALASLQAEGLAAAVHGKGWPGASLPGQPAMPPGRDGHCRRRCAWSSSWRSW